MRTLSMLVLAVTAACALAAWPSAASPQPDPALTVRASQFGPILYDGRGFALYAFTRDRSGRSRCTGACARAWPPYVVRGRPRASGGLDALRLGTVRRADGRLQLTFAGRPLYSYVGDRKPLQVLCQNVREYGGLWLVVKPTGALVR